MAERLLRGVGVGVPERRRRRVLRLPAGVLSNPDGTAPAQGCTAPAPGVTAGPVALSGALRDLMSLEPVAGQV